MKSGQGQPGRPRVCVRVGLVTASFLLLIVSNVYAEMYIGGQVGLPFFGDNNKLTRVDLTDLGPPGFTVSPPGSMSGRDLKSSPMVGGKVGYYFPPAPWLGLEIEAYYTTPHIEQQPTRITFHPGTVITGVGSSPSGSETVSMFTGDHFRVITIAPFNLMFRYHKSRFQPYVGVGPGIFLARTKTIIPGLEGTQSSMTVGLNAKLGAEYLITRHISAYGEVRYNYTTLDFDANSAGAFGFKAIYNPITFSVGIGYHF